MSNKSKKIDNETRLKRIRNGAPAGLRVKPAIKVGLHQEGGQFAPQVSNTWNMIEVENLRRKYGWSEKTILKRQGIFKKTPYKDLIEEILEEGHGVLTRAPNTCEKCGRDTVAGEIVLGVVHGGYGYGGSDRYYLCSTCVREYAK